MTHLPPWMTILLRFAGTFNLLAGAGMFCLHHEGCKLLGMATPPMALPIQIVGILVALFGVGYHLVAAHPIENRNILLLGWWSKALSSATALFYVAAGRLPWRFALAVFLADVIYLPPFLVILRRIDRLRRAKGG